METPCKEEDIENGKCPGRLITYKACRYGEGNCDGQPELEAEY